MIRVQRNVSSSIASSSSPSSAGLLLFRSSIHQILPSSGAAAVGGMFTMYEFKTAAAGAGKHDPRTSRPVLNFSKTCQISPYGPL